MNHTEKVDEPHKHGHPGWMMGMMIGCLFIGGLGLVYPSFYLDLAFLLTMGFCVGHHLWHRFRHSQPKIDPTLRAEPPKDL